jgi:hypothetical protein
VPTHPRTILGFMGSFVSCTSRNQIGLLYDVNSLRNFKKNL